MQNDHEQGGRPTERSVTIRFSQVDPAGIVFYPRYFELLFRCFPDLPIARAPFSMQTDFRRANRIGDRLRIVCEHDGNGNGRRCWSYSGRIGEVEYFSIRSLPGGDPEPASAAARPADPAFIGEAETVGAWASGIGGQLQLFRYFELLSDAIEQWFEALLDVPFRHLHMERRVGIPTVRFTTHCRALPRIGDTVSIGIRPDAVGNSSLRFTSWLLSDGECLIENRQVIVFVERAEDRIGSMPIPADVRERLTAQLAASGGGADD